ncbi:ribonuclease H-like domain-containing protein [Lentinula lateritia]|uniref:Ribonuclease H-like domain-containing protein n=1 Tax=Lentinula aff. lateritia TaxID=2804960 RepID=A0ACC1UAD1_9AGAR|nr:ribonuclease H-like domain-containing protein [Lentinula aff. lateritia]KAJ3850120.1 ribonuclease H-like domain-containing protein [Lentinula lateritia]
MAFTIFRATRYIGQYLKSLTTFRGLRYISSYRTAQDKPTNLNSDPEYSDPLSCSEDHDATIPFPTSKLRVFDLPKGFRPTLLKRPDYIEKALEPLAKVIDQDSLTTLYLSMDAEWNIRRRSGVSIIQLCPHIDPTVVYIIAVHQLSSLPPSLLRLLTSERVWKIGSRIKGDLTRLRKQFPSQLHDSVRFSTIDLKEYALAGRFIQPNQSGALASLCETVLGQRLPKDQDTRANNSWEYLTISPSLLHYAACDVLASRRIFEKMLGDQVDRSVPPDEVKSALEQDPVREIQAQIIETGATAELCHLRV